ncbi:membrane protein [Halostagnicola larsenii XH-48]|uniref:Membrane protein n=1 Tax=Halostagnicola larsenii XH-48 TaxID=797299 RepID=W0JSV9_9EURY|nr:site-2 protease family protein [Halostagnicola larsenii]AHG00377.1 membrane protein [Halostagnicola larsenii XH-48]
MDGPDSSAVGRHWYSSVNNDVDPPDDGPSLERIESTFVVSETRREDETLLYVGTPLVSPESMMRELWSVFRESGYEARLTVRDGRYVIVAEPTRLGVRGIPWTNILLFVATVVSTLFAGSMWYYTDPFSNPAEIWQAWPFTAAILGVLGVHEMGHYLMSRYHRVSASLPYFIPIPTLIGTMGAVIKMKGRMPDRKALFDIGAAGPLAGLVATVGVISVGLHLPPVAVPDQLLTDPNTVELRLGYPPLLEFLASAFDQPLYRNDPARDVNPVVIGGWVGLFVTFLNLIPVGQLDGGHILRSMAGSFQRTIAAIVPGALFALAGYLYYVGDHSLNTVLIWCFWGVITIFVATAGPARPVHDEPLDPKRFALGVATFGIGLLCFTPVPVTVVG